MATIELNHVSKTYPGDVRAVSEATLAFRDGEFIVLVGPSGCGKSTLLRMIAGLEAITGGTVAIGGRVVNDLPPKDRDVAMVFQNYALYPHMTVEKNMAFGLLRRRKHSGLSGLLFYAAERRAELAPASSNAAVSVASQYPLRCSSVCARASRSREWTMSTPPMATYTAFAVAFGDTGDDRVESAVPSAST